MEAVARVVLNVRQVMRIAGVREYVDIGNLDIRLFCQLQTNEVGSNKAAATGDQKSFHGSSCVEK